MLRFDSIDTLGRALTHQRERHSALSKNVANLETPGYRPIDLEELDPSDGVSAMEVVDDDRAPGADGNTVSLERQMAKLSETKVRYSAATTLTSKRLALLAYAASGGA